VFFTRPISVGFLMLSAALLATMTISGVRKRRSEVFRD
jgi:TctA family transporter